MIVMTIKGGLGNQLFQYACGRALALRLKTELKLDLFWYIRRGDFDSTYGQYYYLNHFNIQESIVDKDELTKIKFFNEPNFTFCKQIFRLAGDLHLEGYWQSEKYFEEITDILLKEFTLKDSLDLANKQMLGTIEDTQNSVCVHVRHGRDLAIVPKFVNLFGADYYTKGIEAILKVKKNAVFFVFSDNMRWAKENLNENKYPIVFVDNNNNNSCYLDLHLMSSCQHHIMPASTFSWWAAWLASHKKFDESIVLRPPHYFAVANVDDKDLFPNSWKVLV